MNRAESTTRNPPKRGKESNKRTATMNTNRESSRALASSHVLVRSDSPSTTNHCQHRLKYRADADQPFAHKHEREQLTRGRFLASHSREQKEGESNETSNTNLKAELEQPNSSPTTCWPRTTPTTTTTTRPLSPLVPGHEISQHPTRVQKDKERPGE